MLRYPRKYEEATEIVDLLLSNESILIDFQYSDWKYKHVVVLDYLDGARYILAEIFVVWQVPCTLLTPINVVVNIEDVPFQMMWK